MQARAEFLARFRPEGQGLGFAVLGGVFAEGVDLPGSLLIGAFIATLGLPPVSVTQDHIQARLDQRINFSGLATATPTWCRRCSAWCRRPVVS